MTHPCDGHTCDRCWICQAGVCCLTDLGRRLKSGAQAAPNSLDTLRTAMSNELQPISDLRASLLLDALHTSLRQTDASALAHASTLQPATHRLPTFERASLAPAPPFDQVPNPKEKDNARLPRPS